MSENSSLLFCFQLKGKNIERCKLLIGLVIKAAVEGGCCILSRKTKLCDTKFCHQLVITETKYEFIYIVALVEIHVGLQSMSQLLWNAKFLNARFWNTNILKFYLGFWHSKIMDSGFDAILWCDHRIETFLAELLLCTISFSVFYKTKLGIVQFRIKYFTAEYKY